MCADIRVCIAPGQVHIGLGLRIESQGEHVEGTIIRFDQYIPGGGDDQLTDSAAQGSMLGDILDIWLGARKLPGTRIERILSMHTPMLIRGPADSINISTRPLGELTDFQSLAHHGYHFPYLAFTQEFSQLTFTGRLRSIHIHRNINPIVFE